LNYYENEIKALKKANRYRKREIFNQELKDFASNDYLGLSHKKALHTITCRQLEELSQHSPKASMLVNGYHFIHKDLEESLWRINNFEDAIVLGSGFNANIALIDTLARKGDILFMDEFYHASGILATDLKHVKVVFFKHNDMQELRQLLRSTKARRKIVAVEGIYSMEGDMVAKEVFDICDEEEAILIVDEAHSSGVIGKNLSGIFDYYDINIKPNYIKMGTLGKAYGSFGAYILASGHIIDYLINRAKPVIYATALSLYDTLLAHNSLLYIEKNSIVLKKKIKSRQKIVYDKLDFKIDSLIVPIEIGDNKKVMKIKDDMLKCGYTIGAIRQPTVKKAIIRLIVGLAEERAELVNVCELLNEKL